MAMNSIIFSSIFALSLLLCNLVPKSDAVALSRYGRANLSRYGRANLSRYGRANLSRYGKRSDSGLEEPNEYDVLQFQFAISPNTKGLCKHTGVGTLYTCVFSESEDTPAINLKS